MNKNIVSVRENKETNYETQTMGETIYVYKGNKTLVAAYSKSIGRLHTYNLSKAEQRKVRKIIIAKLKENKITKQEAKEFYNKLRGKQNESKDYCDIMTVELIAKRMEISMKKAEMFCNAMVNYKIANLDDGMIII